MISSSVDKITEASSHPIITNPINEKDLKTQTIAQKIICHNCEKELSKKTTCGGCRKVYYCNVKCQAAAWPSHRPECLKSKAVDSVKNNPTLPSTETKESVTPWRAVLKDLTHATAPLKKWKPVVYEIDTKNKEGLVFFSDCFAIVTALMRTQAEKLIKKKLLENPKLQGQTFLIPCSTFLKGIRGELEDIQTMMPQTSVKWPDHFFSKINKLAELYFNTLGVSTIPFSTESEKEYRATLLSLKIDLDHSVFVNSEWLGFDISKQDISITDDHLKAFDTSHSQTKVDLKNLTCASYTLLICGEKQAKKYIFQEQSHILEVLLDLLDEGHYEPVEFPQGGDLVVYFNDTNTDPTHIGQCTSSGLVISKLGTKNPYRFEHKLHDVSVTYGKKVVFFRKNQGGSLS